MLERVLPSTVVAVEAFGDPPGAVLWPRELALVARAVDKRRREFTTVRHCARVAMVRLGVPPAAVLPGRHNAPQWPTGVVGSLTHCDGYRAAALAWHTDVHSLGIDAEPHAPLPDGVLPVISRPEERAELRRLADSYPSVHWDRLLFSVKESVYKAWYPLARRWLGFEDASVVLDPNGGFTATVLIPGPVAGFDGRWLVEEGIVAAAIAHRTPRAAPEPAVRVDGRSRGAPRVR